MKYISSRDNRFFKQLFKLASSSRQRKKSAQTLLDGIHLVQAYWVCGFTPQHLLLTELALQDGEVAALLEQYPAVPITLLDTRLFAELSELKTPGGILALIEQPMPALSPKNSCFALLLEDVQDPGNLGSMLRSAAAAGCDAVFLSPGCADAWSPKVLRAGMGGHFALRQSSGQVMSIHESADLLAVAAAFKGHVLAASLAAQTSLYQCELRGKLAFAVGNEGAGLSASLLAVSTQHFTIPMPGKVESLNVAAATAVCLFEVLRQRELQVGES